MDATDHLENDVLQAGEGVVDITPPLEIELSGFHFQPGNERLITGIRQPTSTRALVLRLKRVETAIVSMEICAVSGDFVKRVQARVANQVEIPAENVRICVTHTHSMPTLRYFRQWGAIPAKKPIWMFWKTALFKRLSAPRKIWHQRICMWAKRVQLGGILIAPQKLG